MNRLPFVLVAPGEGYLGAARPLFVSEGLPTPPGPPENKANVRGREVTSTGDGFGQLWEKEISAVLEGVEDPVAVMTFWRENLASLWPAGGELFLREAAPQAGDTLGVDVSVGPTQVATGVVVASVTPTSMTLRTPQGHVFAGSNQLTAERVRGGVRLAVCIAVRAQDPLFELGLMAGGHRKEEQFWAEMLRNVAAHYGNRPKVRLRRRLKDAHRRWSHFGNMRHNALLNSLFRKLFHRRAA